MSGLNGTKSFLEVQRRNELYIIFDHKLRKRFMKEVQFGVSITE